MHTDIDCRDILSLPEFEERARSVMPAMAFEYIASGAADEHTVRWNREAFDRIRLRPRMLRDVASVDTRVTLFGQDLSFPVLLAPTAYHRVIHPDGEIATARGAAAAGIPWMVSIGTTTPLAEIAAAVSAPLWFQLYFQSDRPFTGDVVRQAEAAGCRVMCVTVDSPVLGARNRQTRAGFKLPPEVRTPHLFDIGHRRQAIIDPRRVAATWKDVEWLRGFTRLPIVIKGILDADDAELAVQFGAEGVVVSNHGGRNLDTAVAAIDAVPEVVDRIGGRVPVLMDGGVRRGTDVLKALALGASAVLIGRPYCYALGLAGSAGICRVVEILRSEFEAAMMLSGAASIKDIDATLLWNRPARR